MNYNLEWIQYHPIPTAGRGQVRDLPRALCMHVYAFLSPLLCRFFDMQRTYVLGWTTREVAVTA